MIEQLILENICRHFKDKKFIRRCHHDYMLTNMINFSNELADERRAADIVCLDFRKAFNTLCHRNLTKNLSMYGQDEQTGW